MTLLNGRSLSLRRELLLVPDWLNQKLSASALNMYFGETEHGVVRVRVTNSHHHDWRWILLYLDYVRAGREHLCSVTNIVCPWQPRQVAIQGRQFILTITLIIQVLNSCRRREEPRGWLFSISQTTLHYLIVVLLESWWIEYFNFRRLRLKCANMHNCGFISLRDINGMLGRQYPALMRHLVEFLLFLQRLATVSLTEQLSELNICW